MGQTQTDVKKQSNLRGVIRGLVCALVVFTAGYGIGSGQINLDLHGHHSENANLPTRLDYNSVNQIYKSLKDNYDGKLTETQLEDGLKHGLAEAAKDPYTTYFTAKEAKDFNDQLNNSFSGIGAQLGKDKDGNLEVIAPIDDLPAAKAGVKAGDLITSINGVNTSGISVDDAVSKIRGPKNTKVALQIVRDKAQTLTITITRDDITIPSVKTKILDGNIGYLQITTFADDTVGLVQKAADDFKSKQVKGIVLDLRDDPGGLLDAATRVSSLWLPNGQTVLQEKRGSEVTKTYDAQSDGVLQGIPTVVLINGGSASASEIVAGALHDNKAAYVIGSKSYGKGVVQQLINLCKRPVADDSTCNGDGGQLKVTVASWYRPNGQNINHRGITPDQVIKLTDANTKDGADPQLQAAKTRLTQ